MLALAKAAGVRVLDTARAYGESEKLIGQFAGEDPHWLIVTKLHPDAESREEAEASLEASRAALRRSNLDIILLHRMPQRRTVGEHLWDTLRWERDAGRVKLLGISANTPDEAFQALNNSECDCIQVACNLFDQRLSRSGFFEQARQAGRTVFIRSVFLQGVAHLNPAELPPHLRLLQSPLSRVRAWAAEGAVPTATAFLAFVAGLPAEYVLVGCESLEQLECNLASWKSAEDHVVAVQTVAARIDPLPEEVVCPSLWHSPRHPTRTEPG